MFRPWLARPQHVLVSISYASSFEARRVAFLFKPATNKTFHSDSRSTTPAFSYRFAAAAVGKNSRLKAAEHAVNFWTQRDVEAEKPIFNSVEANSGQDAFLMAQLGRSRRHVVLSVVDGVGGWESHGVNPAAFAHGLTRHMAEATLRPEQELDLRPMNLLQMGYDQVQKDGSIHAGGSTACVASIDPTGLLEIANLGDSGFVILSPGKVTYRSLPQTSAFNTPFQLSKLTSQMMQQRQMYGGPTHDNLPADSDVTHHDLQHGDVVIIGTDGLWDNLSPIEVLHLVAKVMGAADLWMISSSSGKSPTSGINAAKLRSSLVSAAEEPEHDIAGKIAYEVLKEGKRAGLDRKRDGPFAKEVHKYYPHENFHGGKADDIAVIACVAVQDEVKAVKARL